MMEEKVVILGARGSVPVDGKEYMNYGGASTCVFIRLGDQAIIIDCGTGMMNLPKYLNEEDKQLTILLSHSHMDHLLGLPMCPVMFDPANKIDIYGAVRNGKNVQQQVCTFLSPPLWPVGPDQFPAAISFRNLPQTFSLGEVLVESMNGVHPGGVSLFRLSGGGKKIVCMTDCTLTEAVMPKLTEFAKDCDLLLCDGQYSQQEWKGKEHFGHSTWVAAAKLGVACGAHQVRIIHHDPSRTDEQLDHAALELALIHNNCAFARAEEQLLL